MTAFFSKATRKANTSGEFWRVVKESASRVEKRFGDLELTYIVLGAALVFSAFTIGVASIRDASGSTNKFPHCCGRK
jgi:hypothetical protein